MADGLCVVRSVMQDEPKEGGIKEMIWAVIRHACYLYTTE